MKVIRDIRQFSEPAIAATVGFFDGVHRGHRFLIGGLCRHAAERRMPAAVVTFAQHPREVLHSGYQPRLLNTFEEKMEQLAATGIDYVVVMDFTSELATLSAKDFIKNILFEKMNVRVLLVGYDHRFGHHRKDGFEQYVSYGSECGMEVLQAAPYQYGGLDVSSSKIRQLIECGNVADAEVSLGYCYPLKGRIVEGRKIGRSIGFPTANIEMDNPSKVLPAFGVYAVFVTIGSERRQGMLYIGSRPTMHDLQPFSIEVHVLDFSGDLYGKEVTVHFVDFVRADEQFSSLDALQRQLQSDRETIHQILSSRERIWNGFTMQ